MDSLNQKSILKKYIKKQTDREKMLYLRRVFGLKPNSIQKARSLKKPKAIKAELSKYADEIHWIRTGEKADIQGNIQKMEKPQVLPEQRDIYNIKLLIRVAGTTDYVITIYGLLGQEQVAKPRLHLLSFIEKEFSREIFKTLYKYGNIHTSETIEVKDIELTKLNKTVADLKKIYYQRALENKFNYKDFLEKHCAENILLHELSKRRKITREKLREELNLIADYKHEEGMTLELLQDYCNSKNGIRLVVLDQFQMVLINDIPEKQTTNFVLCYQQNRHLVGIHDISIKRSILKHLESGEKMIDIFDLYKKPKYNQDSMIIKEELDKLPFEVEEVFANPLGKIDCAITKNKTVFCRPHFDITKKILDIFKLPYEGETFIQGIKKVLHLTIKMSEYDSYYYDPDLIDTSYTQAQIYKFSDEKGKVCDLPKAYLQALVALSHVPVFTYFDKEIKYTNQVISDFDECTVSKMTSLGPIDHRLSGKTIKYLIEIGEIQKEDIQTILQPTAVKDITPIKRFISVIGKLLNQNFPKDIAKKYYKKMYCAVIGMLGKRYTTSSKRVVCEDENTAIILSSIHKGHFAAINNEFHVIKNTRTRLKKDTSVINRFVISECTRQLFEKWVSVGKPEVYWVNTDSFCIPKSCETPKGMIEKPNEQARPSKDFEPRTFVATPINFEEKTGKNFEFRNNKLYQGMPGTGKSTKLKELFEKEPGVILAPTHAAAKNLGDNAFTLKHYLMKKKKDISGVIYLDEIFMCDPMQLSELVSRHHGTLIGFGDPDQLVPVTDHYYDYTVNEPFKELFPEVIDLKYIEGCSRMEKELKEYMEQINNSGEIQELNRELLYPETLHICSTNQRKDTINKSYTGKEYMIIKNFKRGKERYTKQEIVEKVRIRGNQITIRKANGNQCTVPLDYVQPNYALTAHRVQGMTIPEKNIVLHVDEYFSKRHAYVAGTRARKMDQISVKVHKEGNTSFKFSERKYFRKKIIDYNPEDKDASSLHNRLKKKRFAASTTNKM